MHCRLYLEFLYCFPTVLDSKASVSVTSVTHSVTVSSCPGVAAPKYFKVSEKTEHFEGTDMYKLLVKHFVSVLEKNML